MTYRLSALICYLRSRSANREYKKGENKKLITSCSPCCSRYRQSYLEWFLIRYHSINQVTNLSDGGLYFFQHSSLDRNTRQVYRKYLLQEELCIVMRIMVMVLILPISIRFSLEMYLRLLTVYSHQNRDQEQVIIPLVKSEMEKH